MIAHSAEVDAAIVAGATATQRLTVLRGGQPALAEGLYGVGLQVTLDDTAPCWRTLTGGIANPDGDLYPHLATDPLAPYGSELFVEIGVTVAGGDVAYLPAGVFRLWGSGDGDPRKPIALRGSDRMSVIAAALDEAPWVIAAGTSLADAVTAYLQFKYPGLPVVCDADSANIEIPTTVVWLPNSGQDPSQNVQGLAANYGRQVFIDATGQGVLRPVPDSATVLPCWEYAPGPDNLAEPAAPSHDPTVVHNVAVVSWAGSGVDTPVTVAREVTDPTSPVYPPLFGRKPIFYTSQLFTDVSQMEDYGDKLLLREQGAAVNLPFTAAPHPAHEPGDVVTYSSDLGGVHAALLALSRWTLACDLRTPATYTTRRLG